MKSNLFQGLILVSASLLATESFAASSLACWNLHSKAGSKPTLTAQILRDDELGNFKINQDPDAAGFKIQDLKDSVVGTEITSKRSPYIGNREFIIAKGIRLILPMNLSPAGLEQAKIKAGNLPGNLASRQNGVLDAAGGLFDPMSGGDIYTRMHCTAH